MYVKQCLQTQKSVFTWIKSVTPKELSIFNDYGGSAMLSKAVLCFILRVSKWGWEKRTNETDGRRVGRLQRLSWSVGGDDGRSERASERARLSPTLTIDCFVFGARRVAIGILSWSSSDVVVVVVSRPSRPAPTYRRRRRRTPDRLRDAEKRVASRRERKRDRRRHSSTSAAHACTMPADRSVRPRNAVSCLLC